MKSINNDKKNFAGENACNGKINLMVTGDHPHPDKKNCIEVKQELK